MSVHPLDRLAVAIARGTTRRTFLASIGAAIGVTVASRVGVQAQATCSSDADCVGLGLICNSTSICGFPECSGLGGSCASHDDCCIDLICTSGVCTVSPQCALPGAGCASNGECCTGMICLGGICANEPPAPPENTGGGGGGGTGGDADSGGGSGGGETGGNSGGGGGGNPSGSGTWTTGTTTGGVAVAALPSTGIAGESVRREKWGIAAAALAGAAGLFGLSRRTSDQSIEPTVGTQDED